MSKHLHHHLDLDGGGSAFRPPPSEEHHPHAQEGSWNQPSSFGSAGDLPSWQRGEGSLGEQHPVAGPYSTNHCYDGGGGGDAPSWMAENGPTHHAGAELGWGDAAWGEAGGFDAVLVGHLIGQLAGSGLGPIVVIPIEHLEINNITQVETTQVLLNAANGGSIQIGGAVNAEASQGLLGATDGLHDAGHGGGLGAGGLGHETSATNDVTLVAGNGDGNFIGGNVTAIADQHLPDAHFF